MRAAAPSAATVHACGVSAASARREPRLGLVDAEVRDGVGREVGDERRSSFSRSRGSMRRNSLRRSRRRGGTKSTPTISRTSVALLEQLGDAGPELAAHPGHEDPHQRSSSTVGRRAGRRLGTQLREEDHLTDASDSGEQHHERSIPMPEPAARRHAVLERPQVVLVDVVRLVVAERLRAGPAPRSGAAGRPGR